MANPPTWRLWLPPLLWAGMIFCLSSVSFDQVAPTPGFLERYGLDKPVHAALFGGLAWLLLRAVDRGTRLTWPLALGIVLVTVSGYGASDEWHQSFVPGRYPSWGDWLADTAGAALAVWTYHRVAAAQSPIASRIR